MSNSVEQLNECYRKGECQKHPEVSESTETPGYLSRHEKAFEWLEENTPLVRYDWAAGKERGWIVEDTDITKGKDLLETIEKAMGI